MINNLQRVMNEEEWKDWKWQQRNSLHSVKQIREYFPNFPEEELIDIEEYSKKRRWGITPYTLSLMKKDSLGNPSKTDPIVKQVFPIRGFGIDTSDESYGRGTESNWELPQDMATPIMQHKYTNKVIVRAPNSCLGYCGFCFEVARVEDKETKKDSINDTLWKKSMQYIRDHSEVMEVILSGGDPLLSDNKTLEGRLSDVRAIPHVKELRIHTRALTFNPFRIDNELVELFKNYRVNALGVHICHPNELTNNTQEAFNRFDEGKYGSIIKLGQIPLLKGINDDPKTLRELFIKMYDFGIKPYYLFHSMPWSQSAESYRTSVREGVTLMKSVKRHLPNVAVPEYVIVHNEGKQTVPLEDSGTPEFQYTQDEKGRNVIKFKNWKNNWETYLDS